MAMSCWADERTKIKAPKQICIATMISDWRGAAAWTDSIGEETWRHPLSIHRSIVQMPTAKHGDPLIIITVDSVNSIILPCSGCVRFAFNGHRGVSEFMKLFYDSIRALTVYDSVRAPFDLCPDAAVLALFLCGKYKLTHFLCEIVKYAALVCSNLQFFRRKKWEWKNGMDRTIWVWNV